MTCRFRKLAHADVPAAFDTSATVYDKLVAASPGYHEQLRISVRRMRLPDDGRGLRVLDAGCGTGASTAALLAVAPHARIVAVDASAGMLAQAAGKPWPATVRFVLGRVEDPGAAGIEGPFDAIFAAYLLRNLADPDVGLRALRGLLRPGGLLAVHEYSVRDSPLATAAWNLLCWAVVIPAGRLASGDGSLYRYLRRSVNDFDGATSFQKRLRDNGFSAVRSKTMPGWQRHMVHTFLAEAPR
ncbi:ubiquinone biosynthesis methyltransferase UbiE [Mycobacterium heckeshornense]|uniref:Ubiquinone/menaquinone biosynthesis methyltransferase n=1 Tax=Mycobacterium heckeshornense TaxID=110505 RepID=A0A2G8BJJ8_9MYCO|nr:class I SAM-dependent methyltransferase [Mycobacterium heckeshornense]MCV7035511.1 class I SAM-dependent methyltransferase [Mycobacterium heckeshornense]PIJ37925.1 ubiquinone biosynthesis methyltransferase UbiE [Mycobacterium heckeshornense]BCO37891.1 ubiquinone/menaquinone biosynthesis methyltransferase [Mycobacterium heckeshornense]BCQ10757.1 ubiquinone/menaquinone biosynthesis methyltransferase [Mycobacterium heckeshornense]